MAGLLRVVIAGGGTGGHAFPALALAQALTAGGGAEVRLVGTTVGPEAAAAAAAGIPFEALPVSGFRRSLAPAALAHNAAAAGEAAGAALKARAILRRARAQVAVGTGGYASIPIALAAAAARIPLVVQEQNAVPGRANRLARRWAAAAALSFPGSERFFASVPIVRLTGNPVRPELAHLDRDSLRPEARRLFGLEEDRQTLLVFGGSQGARRLNEAAFGSYGAWRGESGLQVLHLVGRSQLVAAEQRLAALRREGDQLLWRPVGFTDRMDLAYAIADLAVSRAGASALFELAAAALPAIVVPYPHAGDHQRYNTEALLELEAIVLMYDHECTAETFQWAVRQLLDDPARRSAMSRALAGFARPDAARAMAELVREVAAR